MGEKAYFQSGEVEDCEEDEYQRRELFLHFGNLTCCKRITKMRIWRLIDKDERKK